MLCFNFPRKTTAMIQVWGCIFLAILAVFFSFAPIITIDLADKDTVDTINDVIDELDVDLGSFEFPEKLEVTSLKLVSSVRFIAKIVKVAGEVQNTVLNSPESDEVVDAAKKELEELEEMAKGEEGANTILIAAAFASTISGVFGENDNSNSGIIGTILNIGVVAIALLYCLWFAFIAPVIFIFVAVTSLIAALTNLKDPCRAATKITNKMPRMVTLPMVFMLLQCVVPGLNYGFGALGLWIITLISVIFNVAISRMRLYVSNEEKYLNIMQGVSLVSVIGFLVYFFNIIKTGVFHTFITGHWGEVVISAEIAKKAHREVVSNGYIVDAVLVLAAVLMVVFSIDAFRDILGRISCSSKKKSDSFILGAVILALSTIFPMIVINSKNYYTVITDMNSEPVGSFLDGLSASGESALKAALVGAIIVVIAEIALIVLKKMYCKELSKETVISIISGTAKTPDEKLADAKKVIEDIGETAPAAATAEESTESVDVK